MHPSTLIGRTKGRVYVIGPKQAVEVPNWNASNLKSALSLAGAIRSADHKTYVAMARFYCDPIVSRTAAFVDAITSGPKKALHILQKIQAMSVAIVGCGGIGSSVAYLLAGLSVKRLILIDGDVVELSNLNRQFLYSRRSVGKKKAYELKEALVDRFTHTKIVAIADHFPTSRAAHMLASASHVVCCADDPPHLFSSLQSYCDKKQEIWSGGYLLGVSTIQRHKPEKQKQLTEWLPRMNYFAPSIGFQNFEVAANLVARMALGSTKEKHIFFDYRDL